MDAAGSVAKRVAFDSSISHGYHLGFFYSNFWAFLRIIHQKTDKLLHHVIHFHTRNSSLFTLEFCFFSPSPPTRKFSIFSLFSTWLSISNCEQAIFNPLLQQKWLSSTFFSQFPLSGSVVHRIMCL